MTVPSTSWDETTPAGSDNINAGDNRIRELKTQIREVVDVDHDFPSSGQDAGNGQHKQVTLQEQADLGTGAVGATILGSQTVSGKGELVYTDEDDNDIQITKAGEVLPPASPTLANWAGVIGLIYPVGSIYANASDSTNPGTLLGVGTWVAIEEEVIAGYKLGGTFDPVGSLATGAETVTLTAAQSGLPAHTHTVAGTEENSGGTQDSFQNALNVTDNSVATSDVVGGAASASEAHNNIQPTYVAYLWRRTA
jgi:hypothetical protein